MHIPPGDQRRALQRSGLEHGPYEGWQRVTGLVQPGEEEGKEGPYVPSLRGAQEARGHDLQKGLFWFT